MLFTDLRQQRDDSTSVTLNEHTVQIAATLWWFTVALKPLKILVFGGLRSPQGSYSPYILGDTTKPGHVTCILV